MLFKLTLLAFVYACMSYAQTVTLPPDFKIDSCQPAVQEFELMGSFNQTAEDRVAELFNADQTERNEAFTEGEPLNPDLLDAMTRNDFDRRAEVYGYLLDGQLASGQAFYHAAFIFQHGGCSEHYALANKLAEQAIELGYEEAKWIYAASLDRYLLSIGEQQKFGTQFHSDDGCTYTLEPLDPNTTNEERAAYNVPPPAERANEFSKTGENCQD